MFHLDTIWAGVATGLQDFVISGILHWITTLFSGIFPQG